MPRNRLSLARRDYNTSKQIMQRLRFLNDTYPGELFNKSSIEAAINSNTDKAFLKRIGADPNLYSMVDNEDNVAQNTFLLSPDLQERYFLQKGWKKGKPGDYPLVKKAVNELLGYTGKSDVPVYQKFNDDIDRKYLTPLGNVNTMPLTPTVSALGDMGEYPTAVYVGKDGNIYQKAWDLNNYGGDSYGGITSLVKAFADHPGNKLDKLGSPVVVTNGYKRVDNDVFLNAVLDGLTLNNRPSNYAELLRNNWNYHLLPEVVVTPKNENIFKRLFKRLGFENGGVVRRNLDSTIGLAI